MRQSDDNVNQSAGTDDSDVLELIHRVMHQVRSRQYAAVREAAGITHMDSKVLGYFGRNPGATQSDLVAHTGRDKAQIARLIKGLRDRGLLAGETDEADRRNVRLSLTREGAALQRGLRREGGRLSTRAVAGFSEAERLQLQALLRRVQANLDAAD